MTNTQTLQNAEFSPTTDRATLAWRLAGVVGFALLTAVAAKIRFYFPDSPVPITLQSMVVVLAGVTLGGWLGTASMLFYLLLGVAHYHVFTNPDPRSLGLIYLFGSTGGYLAGFALAQPLVAWLTAGRDGRRWTRLAGALLAGHVVILALGAVWFGIWAGYGVMETLDKGVLRFLPGMAFKIAAALPLAKFAVRCRA